MKILVTGFEPDVGEVFSPTLEIVKSLPIMVENSFIVKLGIPRLYQKSIDAIVAGILEHHPEAVVMIGERSGNSGLSQEFAALNYIDASSPDSSGFQPQNRAVDISGPAAYITTLPINGMVSLTKKAGIPSMVSYSAGVTMNNSIMYGVAHYIRSKKLEIISGFIHVPLTPAQSVAAGLGSPSMAVDDMRLGVQMSLNAVSIYLEKVFSKRESPIRIVNTTKEVEKPLAKFGFYSTGTHQGIPAKSME